MAVYKVVDKKRMDVRIRCLLDETKFCDKCGECSRCDLIPEKICDNCGKCFDEADYNGIKIDKIIMKKPD
ncbi:MAG: hypothetical protein H0Z40_11550 [Desulfotomaculum sp.]|nr:hypothetical protein [Desulfotomaculum sp.]